MVRLADIIRFMFPNAIPARDYHIVADDSGQRIVFWSDDILGPQPTSEQIEAARPLAEAAQLKAAALSALAATDAKMPRGTEDLFNALLAKGLLVLSDLQQPTQDILAQKPALRAKLK